MLGMVLRPVGPQPAAVYWRRRVLLLAAVIIVVVILIRACSGSSPAPRSAAHTGGGTQANSAPTGPCVASTLGLAVHGGHARPGSPVRFVGVVHNPGAGACSLQEAAVPTWTIRSGHTTVWKCRSPTPAAITLPAGARKRLAAITWQGRVSTPPGCKGSTPAQPGAYTVKLRFGGLPAGTLTFSVAPTTGGNSSSASTGTSTGTSSSAGTATSTSSGTSTG